MRAAENLDLAAPAGALHSQDILSVAVWFGLVAGLLEGAGFLGFQSLGWLNWDMANRGVSLEIVWISAFFDLFLFGVLGLALASGARLFPRLPFMRVSVFLFALLTFFDWFALTGRIRHRGVLVLAVGLAVVLTRWFHSHEATALRFWRRTLPWVAAAAVLALVGIQGGAWIMERRAVAALPPSAPESPNILVIVVDTLRADHLSSYGYARSTSPNLDRIAREGVLFENAFATSSWTLPSHGSLLTGRHPQEHGARDGKVLNSRFLTIAEALRDRGYRTGAFSANPSWFSRLYGFGRGFIRFEDYFHSIGDMAARTLYGRKFEQFVLRRLGWEDISARKRASDVNSSLLRWIDANHEKPFFAFLNYFDVHDPYLPSPPYRSQFSQLENPGGVINSYLHRFEARTDEELQGEIDAYDGAIAYTDYHIGQLLEALQARGLAESTLLVITSDHGESFGEHGLFVHRNALYRELIRVPLVLWWPEHLPAGLRVAQPVSNAALPATLMDLIRESDQALFPGPSLAQLWESSQAQLDWPYPMADLAQVSFEVVKQNPNYHGAMKSLVSPRWHYIVNEKLGTELYDWVKDPGELNNLIDTPDGQSIAAEFRSHLENLIAAGSDMSNRRYLNRSK